MTELLASSGPIPDDTWNAMIADLGALESWLDEKDGARLAARHVHVTSTCVVAFIGRLDAEPRGRSPEARIVDLYERRGIGALRELPGEVGFALWDRRARKLIVACDVVGTVALAFAQSTHAVVVSSRALALLRDPSVGRGWDEEYLADILCDVRALRPGSTPFAAIRRVKPGFAMAATGRHFDEREVDRLELKPAGPSSASRVAVARELRDEITRAVEARIADRKACIALSGGLDSSVIAACAAICGERLDLFSMTFGNADEAADAVERGLVSRLVRDHGQMDLHMVDVADSLNDDDAPALLDDPISTAPALRGARLALMRAIRDAGFEAVIDGEGGDEVFDMSMRLLDLVRARDLRAVGRYLRDQGASRASLLWRGVVIPSLPPALGARWTAREPRRMERIPPWLTASFRNAKETRSALEGPYRAPGGGFHEAVRSLLSSGSTVAAWQALGRTWRGHGVTERSPLLDRRVIELVGRAPASMRLHPTITKPLLREVARGLLPEEIRSAPKQLTSYDRVFRQGLAHRTRGDVARQARECAPLDGKLDLRSLAAAIGDARAPSARWGRELFALLDFLNWHARLRREYGIG